MDEFCGQEVKTVTSWENMTCVRYNAGLGSCEDLLSCDGHRRRGRSLRDVYGILFCRTIFGTNPQSAPPPARPFFDSGVLARLRGPHALSRIGRPTLAHISSAQIILTLSTHSF